VTGEGGSRFARPPATVWCPENLPMFRLVRTAILVLIAFAAGVFLARGQAAEDCRAAGGSMVAGVCRGAS
jgi:hypothetical protein